MAGQKVNLEKSEFTYSPNLELNIVTVLANFLAVKPVKAHSIYLGMPLVVGQNRKETFRSLEEKMERKVQDWKNRNLSWAGREILIKACLQPIPLYMMSCFRLPKILCK